MTAPTVVLFTRDLRVRDHPALREACARRSPVVPLFVFEPRLLVRSANRTTFLLRCLRSLDADLRRLGGRLVVRRGEVAHQAAMLAREIGASAVHLSADVTRTAAARIETLRRLLPDVEVRAFPGGAVVEPGAVQPTGGGAFQRFTPYYRRWCGAPRRNVLAPPARLTVPPALRSEPLPAPPSAASPGLPEGGTDAAHRRLEAFLQRIERYGADRDLPAADATSGLSPYLRFGCLSPRELEAACDGLPSAGPFLRQLAWRDFFRQLVAARPELTTQSLSPQVERSWDAEDLALWQEGRTGMPFVDAAMRQLRLEGWIHPRARMVAAAYLVQGCRVPWWEGARHFDRLLVDGDPALNAGNWQWVAGVGTDARPGRKISPVRQGRRFDPQGVYIHRYVPELRSVPAPLVHAPWEDDRILERMGYRKPRGLHRDVRGELGRGSSDDPSSEDR